MIGPPQEVSTFLDYFLEVPQTVLALSVIAILLGVTAIICNTVVLMFYLNQYKKLYPMLYLFNSGCDCLAVLGSILVGVVLVQLYQREEGGSVDLEDEPSNTLIGAVFFVVSVTTRASVVSSLAISVVRLINIMWAHYKINCKVVLGVLTGFLLFWLGFTAAELALTLNKPGKPIECGSSGDNEEILRKEPPKHDGSRKHEGTQNTFDSQGENQSDGEIFSSKIGELFLQPFVGKEIICELENAVDKSLPDLKIFLLEVVPFIIPVCLASFSLVLISYKLLSSKVGRNSDITRTITITVTWLTLFYVLCNVPFFVVLCVLGHPLPENSNNTTVVVRFVTTMMLPAVSACLTPGTLILRGSKIRRFYSEKISSSFRNGGQDNLQSETRFQDTK